jgi:hypothetical protein
MLLLRGNSFEDIAQKLQRAPAFAQAVRWHLYGRHVQGVSRDNWTILIVDYLQDAMKMQRRELQLSRGSQRVPIIKLGDEAQKWALVQMARMEGLYVSGAKKLSGDVIEALNALAAGDPEAVKRIAEARKKEKPILIEAERVEEKPVVSEPSDS